MSIIGKKVLFKTKEMKEPEYGLVLDKNLSYHGDRPLSVNKYLVQLNGDTLCEVLPSEIQLVDDITKGVKITYGKSQAIS